MKYVFFGTPEFAAIVLRRLIQAGLPPIAVVANPDRPVGRKRVLSAPPIKELIRNLKLKNVAILQPEILDDAFRKELQAQKADFFVVAAYAKIIPADVLSLAPQGTIGVHPSLLPELRGASPIQGAILTGAPQTGVTLYRMDERMDHGPILAQERLESYNSVTAHYPELLRSLAALGGDMAARLLPEFFVGRAAEIAQDHARATITKKYKTEDAFITPENLLSAESGDTKEAEFIDRKIRALNPEPGVWTNRDGKRVKLLGAELKNGALHLTRLQVEGKKPQDAAV
ncbi:MAG: methionyl-tRNA formyltransferase [Patescibacteria group bacterium]